MPPHAHASAPKYAKCILSGSLEPENLSPDLFRIGVILPFKPARLDNETLYRLALARTPGIGPAYTKKLLARFGDAQSIFQANRKALETAGIPQDLIAALLRPLDLRSLNSECARMTQKGIRILAPADPDYPRRLHRITDAPDLLFYQGTANLNAQKILAIIGTRQATKYGKELTQRLVRDLAEPDLLIISGLALGIDAAAHLAALHYHVPTVGVLGHGLDIIYPAEHRALSRSMCHQGGLLTSFNDKVKPEKYTFAMRNHLVAGMCDALIVVETGITGGSLLTVDAALSYKKKIFAVPGRLTDEKSEGCLRLIRQGKANLLISARQLAAEMGWHWPASAPTAQSELPFPTASLAGHQTSHLPSPNHPTSPANHVTAPVAQQSARPLPEDRILANLRQKDSLSLDELATISHLDPPSLAVTLLHLELAGKIRPLPGKRYRLIR
jgi:DNA processing protein